MLFEYDPSFFFFFFNDTATTEIYTLSLHDALPISVVQEDPYEHSGVVRYLDLREHRSEEHTSELQSRPHLVCRLLLEKKKVDQTQLLRYGRLARSATTDEIIRL